MKMLLKYGVWVIFAVLLIVCLALSGFVMRDKNNLHVEDVSIIELIATPEKYHGKQVRVVGVGNIDFEGSRLSLSIDDHKQLTGNHIWISLAEGDVLDEEQLKEYNGRYVIVEGYFNKKSLGHGVGANGTLEGVYRYELTLAERQDIDFSAEDEKKADGALGAIVNDLEEKLESADGEAPEVTEVTE